MSDKELLNEIIKKIRDGKLLGTIAEEENLTGKKIRKIINTISDKKLLEEINALIKKNVYRNRQNYPKNNESTIKTMPVDRKRKVVELLANNEITLAEAISYLDTSPFRFFGYLISIDDEVVKPKLEPLLSSYGFNLDSEETHSLANYNYKTLKEIALVALTYRVSFKSIAKLFKVSQLDAFNTFKSFDKFSFALEFLFNETIFEGQIEEKRALYYAKEYYKKRKEIVKKLNSAKISHITDLEKKYEDELKELTSQIDDSLLIEAVSKGAINMTRDELDLLARFQLKYYLSDIVCEEILSIDRKVIFRASEDLRKRDLIYAEKKDIHSNYYHKGQQNVKVEKASIKK